METAGTNYNKSRYYWFLDSNSKKVIVESQYREDNNVFEWVAECGGIDAFIPNGKTQKQLVNFVKDNNNKKITHAQWINYCCIVDAIEDEKLKDDRFNLHKQLFELDDNRSIKLAIEYLIERCYSEDDAYRMVALMLSNNDLPFNTYKSFIVCALPLIYVYDIGYYVGTEEELKKLALKRLDDSNIVECYNESNFDGTLDEYKKYAVETDGVFAYLNFWDGTGQKINVLGREYLVCQAY